jgi:uncharacterized protein YndB with AHSA1/START domain
MRDRQTFVYVSFIRTTPERLWEGLTSGDFTEQYWSNQRIESDWKVSSPVKHIRADGLPEWEILRYEPPRPLSYARGGCG